ncbi:hypothetical protein DPMN_174367 [Dreissena polymorpha]|uniref:Uncharacterized protein n=1 Tax=Dreissena polymorpha TaxID=45954 RepID=A0A9D4E3A1_DREPO|nr:hypothetical protein DPMN_174367 [Dreissena polymorpha]
MDGSKHQSSANESHGWIKTSITSKRVTWLDPNIKLLKGNHRRGSKHQTSKRNHMAGSKHQSTAKESHDRLKTSNPCKEIT